MRLSKITALAFLFSFFAGCNMYVQDKLPPAPNPTGTDRVSAPVEKTEAPVETSAMQPIRAAASLSVLLKLHPEGDPQKIIDFLRTHQDAHITLVFPPRYFEDASRRSFMAQFSTLQSSGIVEIGLALENEPMLPLLADLGLAGDKVSKWGFTYTWPEDVAAQIARGSGRYQKRWSTLPGGFTPPYESLSEQVIQSLKKFRLSWAMGRPSEIWGVRFYGGTGLLVPPMPPAVEDPAEGKEWAEKTAAWAVSFPYVYVDASPLEDPRAEQYFLENLAKRVRSLPVDRPIITLQNMVAALHNEFELPRETDPFKNDYSEWVATPKQKRAWAGLADARKAIDSYQSSGQASLRRLDAAVEEMCNAQSGEFLRNLGAKTTDGTLNDSATAERNFLATLANIYRLCSAPVPSELNTWFTARTFQKTSPVKNALSDGPFFTGSAQSLTWSDPKSDDNGAGNLLYPVGDYPKGMFDLRDVTISWDEDQITVTAEVAESFTAKMPPIVPLVDFYIDVNRLADAGNTAPLRRRGNAAVQREAAWEYALTLSPTVAALYQAVPGSAPRQITLKTVSAKGRQLKASFPRSMLRGSPNQWRISVGLMGTENTRRQEAPLPVPVSTASTDKTFGGGTSGLVAPYVDILDESVEDQSSRFNANSNGGPLTLPYVENQ